MVLLNILVWSGGLGFQVTFTRADGKFNWDWTNGKATGPIILIMACESPTYLLWHLLTLAQITLRMPHTKDWHTTPCLP